MTHPDVERYFMLIPEACQLVLQAASLGADGDVMVLEMGDQVKIVEVAQTLIRMSGRRDIDIVYTGLRPGEKLSEELFSPDERSESTAHELVSRVDVPTLDLILPHNGAGLDRPEYDIAHQAQAAWEAAICWKDDYSVRRLAEVRPV